MRGLLIYYGGTVPGVYSVVLRGGGGFFSHAKIIRDGSRILWCGGSVFFPCMRGLWRNGPRSLYSIVYCGRVAIFLIREDYEESSRSLSVVWCRWLFFLAIENHGESFRRLYFVVLYYSGGCFSSPVNMAMERVPEVHVPAVTGAGVAGGPGLGDGGVGRQQLLLVRHDAAVVAAVRVVVATAALVVVVADLHVLAVDRASHL